MDRTRLLRLALTANVAFSTATGLVMLLRGPTVAEALGDLPAPLVTALGGCLFVFAAGVALVATRPRPARALLVSLLDLGWVVGTVPLVFVPGLLTPLGTACVLVVAGCVGGLAVAQLGGLRRMLRDESPGRGRYRHCVRIRTDVDADALWRVVRDLGDIARYAPDLAASSLRADAAPAAGAVRECSDTSGARWAEHCVALDDDARSFELRFLTDEPGFPFPADVMHGGWSVDDDEGRATVEIWWSLTPTVAFGWVFVALLGLRVDRDMARVVSRMAEVAQGRPIPAHVAPLRHAAC